MRILPGLCVIVLAILLPQNVNANTIYAIDGGTDEIVTLDLATGLERNRYPAPELSSGGPDGLAATRDWLFFINGTGSNMIFRLEPASGAVIGSFPAPEVLGGTDGLAAMDDILFSMEPASDIIARVRISTGEPLGSCTTGMLAGGGLAAETGRLFSTLSLASIVELDPESCRVIGGPFPIPGGDFAYGLAYDGEYLYVGSIIQPGIHTLDPDSGAPLGFLPLSYAPTGLAAAAIDPGPACAFDVDIRPGSTVNVMNVGSRGRLPVALYGSSSVDVGDIEQESLFLSTVPTDHSFFEDVDGDGILDLMLHFRIQALITALAAKHGELEDGMVLEMLLRGSLTGGADCQGADSARIRYVEAGRRQESGNRRNMRGTR